RIPPGWGRAVRRPVAGRIGARGPGDLPSRRPPWARSGGAGVPRRRAAGHAVPGRRHRGRDRLAVRARGRPGLAGGTGLSGARSGEAGGLGGVWATLATSYVAGTPLRPGADAMRRLGEALGRLHALDSTTFTEVGGAEAGGPGAGAGGAAWHPETAVPAALGRPEAGQSLSPAGPRLTLGPVPARPG